MFECLTDRRDLADAWADVPSKVGYQGNTDDFMRYRFERFQT
jgi:hypothetical protein